MTTNENMSIKTALIFLVSHKQLLADILKGRCELTHYISLESHRLAMMNAFLKNHGAAFLASAKMVHEKRWQDLIRAIPHLHAYFHNRLNLYWEAYLKQLSFNEITSKSPMKAAVGFCEFLSKKIVHHQVEKELVNYELRRNRVLCAPTPDVLIRQTMQKELQRSIRLESISLRTATVQMHPAHEFAQYSRNFLLFFAQLKQKGERVLVQDSQEDIRQSVFFYRNFVTGGVSSIEISVPLKYLLGLLYTEHTLENVFNLLNARYRTTMPTYFEMIQELLLSGVVQLHEGYDKSEVERGAHEQ